MKLRLLVMCMAIAILISGSGTTVVRQAKAAALTTSISVVGNHFVDGNGATIRLLGVNRSGSEYMCTGGGSNIFDGPSDNASIAAMASWHINAVRLGLNEDCWLGINGLPVSPLTSAQYKTAIVDYINRLHLQGMYAILELHWNAPGTSQSTGQQVMVDADHGSAFWTSVATTFKTDSQVLFDLYNEPQGISWACLRDGCMAGFQTVGMQSLVNTVRATGATQPILVGGIGYSGDVSQWLTYRPTDSQVVASFHTYDFVGNCNSLSCASTLLSIAASAPLVTGELGETDCGHGFIDSYMPWADTHGISYLGWAWNPYGCSFPGLISAFDGTPSSSFGQGFHDHLEALASNTPAVTLVAPNTGPVVGGTSVTITGTKFTGATAVKFGGASAIFTVNNATQITATSPAGSGVVDVVVTTPGGSSAAVVADKFTYTGPPPPTPTVTVVSPNSGPAAGGTSVTITGTDLTAATAVKFGTTAATTYTVNSATQITATSPSGSGAVDATVTTAGGTSATSGADIFTYIARPVISSIAPSSGAAAGGTSVTITGTNLAAASAVKFGNTAATTFVVNSATQVTATSPLGSGVVDVTVTTAGGTSAVGTADRFTYIGPPSVGSVAPSSGPVGGGTSVVITGANFTAATAVAFGASAATTYTVNSATKITAMSPAGAGIVDVTVTTAIGTSATSASDKFTYVALPTVGLVAPTSGPAAGGTSVVITGTNFTSATAVRFGTTVATYAVNSATQIAATSPAGSGIVDVTVTTAGGTGATSLADQFTYVARPAVGSVAPNSGAGAGGTSVVITGTNLTSATAVKFGTVGAITYAVNSATQITATSPPGSGIADVTVTTAGGTSPTSSSDLFTYVQPGGPYHPLSPQRILDTRTSVGGHLGRLGPQGTMNVQITGQGGVLSTGVSAVVMNVTVTNTSAGGYLTIYPAGVLQPISSNLNWVAGQTVPNLVEVAVGSGGQVTVFNGAGSTDVIFDVAGYVSIPSGTPGTDGLYNPVVPSRILDTRNGNGGYSVPVGPGQTINVQVAGFGGVPSGGVSAVILNVTATGGTAPSYLIVFPTGTTPPLASNLNFLAKQTVANRVIVKVGSGGWVSIYNGSGSVNVIADVGGWFTDGTDLSATGALFRGMTPTRLIDTRNGSGPIGPGGTLVLPVAGQGGVPLSATAVVLNVTVTGPSAASHLTVWPDGTTLPLSSDLNFLTGQTVPNLVVVKLGSGGAIDIYNGAGSANVVVDIVGWYQ